jgi:CBS domain-containing protein
MPKIRDVMTRNVETISPDQSAQDAARFMVRIDAGSLPVTEDNRLVGMITDRDIAIRGIARGHGPDTLVRELMTDDIVSAYVDEEVDDVAAKMSEAQVRRLPVIDENENLCGIVSLSDLSRDGSTGAATQVLEGVSRPGGAHNQ